MRFTKLSLSRSLVASAVVAGALSLGGCASGPSDFLKQASTTPDTTKSMVRDPSQQAALAAALAAQSRGVSAPSGDPSTVMALAAARQQQHDEAAALLQETADAFKPATPAVCDPYSVDPAAACPVKVP